MQTWKNFPLFRLFVFFFLGTVLGIYFPVSNIFPFTLFVGVGLLLLAYTGFKVKKFLVYKNRWHFGIVVAILFTGLSWLFTSFHSPDVLPEKQESQWLKLRLAADVKAKMKSYAAKVTVVQSSRQVQNVGHQLICYLQKSEAAKQLKYGDVIFAKAQISGIAEPLNPYQFDYKQYLKYNGITGQLYLKVDQWYLTGETDGSSLLLWASKSRKFLKEKIASMQLNAETVAVLHALLLGQKDLLTEDLQLAYASAGAMHVLAVSGLHVGIIYIILQALLNLIPNRFLKAWMRLVLLLSILWGFALITGLSASVIRAVTMFSFIAIGKGMLRHVNTFNTIVCSAFVLMLFNPFIIMEVGFQLSYAALIGIIWLQPFIYKRIPKMPWLLDKVWELTSVSVAAQIATFPLGLYYFHQFPSYFFVSNLGVIPLVGILLYYAVFSVALSSFGLVFPMLFKPLDWFVALMNGLVLWVEQIPGALISGLDIDTIEVWLSYLILLFLGIKLIENKKKVLLVLTGLILVFQSFQWYESEQEIKQNGLVVYHIPKHSAIAYYRGTQLELIADSAIIANNGMQLFTMKHHWWQLGLEAPIWIKDGDSLVASGLINRKAPIFEFGDKQGLILRKESDVKWLRYMDFELVVLQKDYSAALYCELLQCHIKYIVMDGILKEYQCKKWQDLWPYQNMHNTYQSGAFEFY